MNSPMVCIPHHPRIASVSPWFGNAASLSIGNGTRSAGVTRRPCSSVSRAARCAKSGVAAKPCHNSAPASESFSNFASFGILRWERSRVTASPAVSSKSGVSDSPRRINSSRKEASAPGSPEITVSDGQRTSERLSGQPASIPAFRATPLMASRGSLSFEIFPEGGTRMAQGVCLSCGRPPRAAAIAKSGMYNEANMIRWRAGGSRNPLASFPAVPRGERRNRGDINRWKV